MIVLAVIKGLQTIGNWHAIIQSYISVLFRRRHESALIRLVAINQDEAILVAANQNGGIGQAPGCSHLIPSV